MVKTQSYDCVHKDKITAVEDDLKLQVGEKVLAVYRGKLFKARIAVTAGTESYLIFGIISEKPT